MVEGLYTHIFCMDVRLKLRMSAKVTECVRAARRLLSTSPVFVRDWITCRYSVYVYVCECKSVQVYSFR